MTQVRTTQAQIEAAAKIIDEMSGCGMVTAERYADAALTAAAEVGQDCKCLHVSRHGHQDDCELAAAAEVGEQKQWPKEFWDEFLRLRRQEEVNAIVERCAQVADEYAKRMKGPEARTAEWIRDDIRALKDKP